MTGPEIMASLRAQLEADAREEARAGELLDRCETAAYDVPLARVIMLDPGAPALVAVAS